jgi:methionine biosynthesis protein MetW
MKFEQPDPDSSAVGFLGYVPDPMRYEYYDPSMFEAHNTIASLIAPTSSVLEIGCGSAILGDVLKERGINNYEGIEPSKQRATASQAKGYRVHPIYLTEETARTLGSYDVVILADVLEHLENPSMMLSHARALMHNQSVLILSVPNIAHWSVRLRLLTGRFNYTETGILDATHLRWFTRSSLQRYLENCGFKIAQHRYTSGYSLPTYAGLKKIFSYIMQENRQRRLLAKIVDRWPELFACQFVYECRP